MQKLRLLSATLALVAVAAFPAQPADDVKPPPAGYRHWFHVNTMIIDKASPLFKDLGGMHNVYVNSVGEAALKKGGSRGRCSQSLGHHGEGLEKNMHRPAAGAFSFGRAEIPRSRW